MFSKPTLPSPFYKLNNLSKYWGIDLWIKRDDLIPQWMGGNKVRKNFAIIKAACKNNIPPDVLITNGSVESNHARVVAMIGSQLGCEVHLVLHGNKPHISNLSNSFFYRNTGANIHYVNVKDIGSVIKSIETTSIVKDKSVYIIPGGGHSKEGAEAYSEAVGELPEAPDYIIHASGTGGTQAGLLRGVSNLKLDTKVIGVSVARKTNLGISEIIDLLPDGFPKEKIIFMDDFTFGGYELYTKELVDFIKLIFKLENIILDSTYTGKAMYALHKLVNRKYIPKDSKVVFWHTGGVSTYNSLIDHNYV